MWLSCNPTLANWPAFVSFRKTKVFDCDCSDKLLRSIRPCALSVCSRAEQSYQNHWLYLIAFALLGCQI